MNRILVAKNKITCDEAIVKGKVVTLIDGEYLLEYICDGDYKLEIVINGNVKLTEVSFDKKINVNNRYVVNNGSLKLVKFYNNLEVLEDDNIDLCNEGVMVDYHFANICRTNEKYTININHKVRNTTSKVINRSIALKNSVLKFIINSNVNKKAVKSVIDQNTRIVTMGECDALISPNMFIPIEDIEAKHGSVIGSFKDDQVFYLMSKGINYNDTLKLLIKGYILGNLEVDFETRQKIIDIIDVYWR